MRALLLLLLATTARATTYSLAIDTAGPVTPLAIVTSTPSGIVCPGTCSAVFSTGTVTLGAVWPSTMAFAGWSGAAGCYDNSASCDMDLQANTTVYAYFDPTLALSLSGTGLGSVSASGWPTCSYAGGCAGGATMTYVSTAGATVVLTETADSSSTFTGWTGDGGCATASTCTVTLNGYENIVATFTLSGPSTMTVTVVGLGVATSTPAGIDCPGTCSATFSPGTSVTLTVTPGQGYYFAGWGNGGCSGVGTCTATINSVQQGLGGAQSPAAYFYPISP